MDQDLTAEEATLLEEYGAALQEAGSKEPAVTSEWMWHYTIPN